MTEVTYLHGIPANEYRDRGKRVGAQPFLNYGQMTVGETRLALASEQAKILAAYYPEMKEFAVGAQELDNLLYKGLHQGIYLGLSAPAFVRRAVGQARGKTQPEGGGILQRRASVGNLIPFEDCDALMTATQDPWAQHEEYIYTENAQSLFCRERNGEIQILNQHLEKSAHHLLYEYVTNANTVPGIVATKHVLHRNAVSKVGQLFVFDRANLVLWLRNGVMRNNALNGAPPYQPEVTINALKPGAGVGEPITLAAITGIITAIIGAVSATVALLKALKAAKEQEIKTVAQGIGTPTFGPEQGDWKNWAGSSQPGATPEGEGGKDLESYLPLLLGGAAILMLK
ncbi:MAG: hypothetical protein HUU01_10370 [Saprospiraceae bacterium]|nr:hypothetical protein [Saprospiraceae bacterium]